MPAISCMGLLFIMFITGTVILSLLFMGVYMELTEIKAMLKKLAAKGEKPDA